MKPGRSSIKHSTPKPYSQARLLHQNNGPFDSSSVSSFNFSDDETSDGDHTPNSHSPFTLHSRGISQTSSTKAPDQRPNLNIITTITVTDANTEPQILKVNEIMVKNAHVKGHTRPFSIASQKASPAMLSPDELCPVPNVRYSPKNVDGNFAKRPNVQNILGKVRRRIERPHGIVTKRRASQHRHEDNAVLGADPITPVIVVTPADTEFPARSHILSGQNHQEATKYNPENRAQTSQPNAPSYQCETTPSADTGESRSPSQGWWNLMLSPLLRSASVASWKTQMAASTPTVPPLPFSPGQSSVLPLSATTDQAFQVSPSEISPQTPRRQGLARELPQKWSEKPSSKEVDEIFGTEHWSSDTTDLKDTFDGNNHDVFVQGTGRAAEYFHACATEQATGLPYFECINHSCLQKLPKLVKDSQNQNIRALGSPFVTPALLTGHFKQDAGSPRITTFPADCSDPLPSPDVLSPHIRQASLVTIVMTQPEKPVRSDHQTKTTIMGIDPDKDKTSTKSTTMEESREVKESGIQEKHDVAPSHSHCPERIAEPHTPLDARHLAMNNPMDNTLSRKYDGANADKTFESSPAQADLLPAYPNQIRHHHTSNSLPQRPAFVNAETEYPELPARQAMAPVTAAALHERDRRLSIERRRRRHEREDSVAKKTGGLWRGRGCISSRNCLGNGGPEQRAKRRWIIVISCFLFTLIIACIVLAITLTRHGDGTPVASQWLNLTGYPAMPTGISTIAAPKLSRSQNQCVSPATLWSCSVPKEDRNAIGSNSPDQPNFRFEIRFRNGTVPGNMTIPIDGNAGNQKTSKDPFTNDIFVANPQPPNIAEQMFLGNTTDNITTPFAGEITPFYITFLPTFPVVPPGYGSEKRPRARRDDTNSSLSNAVPGPSLADDGSAAPANLLPTSPYPQSQPLRLYNRDLPDEHYGFYMYFDKSIYLSGLKLQASQVASFDTPEADQDGGSTKDQASSRCTFSQARFLMKIWTRPGFAELLPAPVNTENASRTNATTSATDFMRPGSFPYPVSATIDRHGGDDDRKGVYCYGMAGGQIFQQNKTVLAEQRDFGGSLINPSPTILESAGDFDKSAGGIDGGTGGCSCSWQNWQ